jgi:hypothetical protein
MGSVAHEKFMQPYIELGLAHRAPLMIMRMDEEGWREFGMSPEIAAVAAQMVSQLEEMGMPMIDALSGLELDRACSRGERIEYAKQAIDELKPGITHFIIHPSADTPELKAITPDWACRAADYQAFSSEEVKKHLAESGVQTIGYRTLQDLIPG